VAETELPKQDLLLKLLKMTTATNDGECLNAIRKANSVLTSAGWDWDKLIAGKIRVVADPFAGVRAPVNTPHGTYRPTPPPVGAPTPPYAQPYAGMKPAPHSPPPPPRQPAPKAPISTKANIFPGFCYSCGVAVPASDGLVFDPAHHNPRAKSKWQIICKSCVNIAPHHVLPNAAPRQKQTKTTPNLSDL